tara:strand:+ start:1056 stop:1421 length:366 start_codon:yes stop_codon:yes gene_type:complete
MDIIFDSISYFLGPTGGMLVHIIKKYLITVTLSLILGTYFYYYQKKIGRFIIISSIFILLPLLLIFKLYMESTPEGMAYYSIYKEHPISTFLNSYIIFGLVMFLLVTNMDKIIKKIKSFFN